MLWNGCGVSVDDVVQLVHVVELAKKGGKREGKVEDRESTKTGNGDPQFYNIIGRSQPPVRAKNS
jgi:hypothetical protein